MAYSTKQLDDLKEKRKKWVNRTMDISKPLYIAIAEQKKERKKSYLKILEHVWKNHSAKPSDTSSHYSAALKEAENYVKADSICIALEEIDKQCQEIGTVVPFCIDPKRNLIILDKPGKVAVANMVDASEYCKRELREVVAVKTTLEKVSCMLAEFWSDLELKAQNKAKNKTTEQLGKTEVTSLEIVEKVAAVNHLKIK